MNCPACNRNLASTLSVCPSCGTMIYDSVREELALKITPIVKTPKKEINKLEIPKIEVKERISIFQQPPVQKPIEQTPVQPVVNKPLTAEIRAKQTVPTLVEFHSTKTTMPEWRLQLQNSVRMRNGRGNSENNFTSAVANSNHQNNLATNGATALKVEIAERSNPVNSPNPVVNSNSTLAKAMSRIEQSRQRYYVEEVKPIVYNNTPAQPVQKNFPYAVHKPLETAPENNLVISGEEVSDSQIHLSAEPKAKFDTNKLPPLPDISSAKVTITKVDLNIDDESEFLEIHKTTSPDVSANAQNKLVDEQVLENSENEVDDFAPISLRFNSAIFDLIIGSFASLVLLSPFMLLNGKFFTIEGLFAFVATCSIVMFIYLTASIGLLGKTLGMKLFSLEIIDIEENDYPTLHQAAVSSAVYLLSLAFGGLGFLTLFVNDEKRAAHDLISGTIIVKEY